MQPDNTEKSFKCAKCGHIFAQGTREEKICPLCGFECTNDTCNSINASNEGY